MSKILVSLTIVSIIVQIIFSFYYSSNIVSQNNQLDENKQKYQQLTIEIAETQKKVTQLTSIDYFLQSTQSANLSPNFKSITVSSF